VASQALINMLNSTDPKQRFTAVKRIARDKDVTMLKQLARMADADPDEQVRSVAARAVKYIKGESLPTSSKPKRQEVSAKDQERARMFVDAAIGYQINGERDKALKELAKALNANPNLETDPFFRSVLEETTGGVGDEAFEVISDSSKMKDVSRSERKLKQEQRAQQHQETVERTSWSSALMDLAIYTFILIFATMAIPIIMGQAAEGFVNGQIAAWEAYEQAVAEGDQSATPPDPVDPEFAAVVEQFQGLGITLSIIVGLVAGIAGVISLLINLFFTHLAARFIFGGQATLPHLIYKVVSFYNSRLPILYGLVILIVILTFSMGGGIIPVIGSFAISIFSLFLFFKTVARVGETYDFGAAKGCMSLIAGGLVVGVISAIIQFAAMGAFMATLESMMAAGAV
jgi:hypothetical protein